MLHICKCTYIHTYIISLADFLIVTVQVFGNDSNKSKFDSGGKSEDTELW
jgi:hypothetical protein